MKFRKTTITAMLLLAPHVACGDDGNPSDPIPERDNTGTTADSGSDYN